MRRMCPVFQAPLAAIVDLIRVNAKWLKANCCCQAARVSNCCCLHVKKNTHAVSVELNQPTAAAQSLTSSNSLDCFLIASTIQKPSAVTSSTFCSCSDLQTTLHTFLFT